LRAAGARRHVPKAIEVRHDQAQRRAACRLQPYITLRIGQTGRDDAIGTRRDELHGQAMHTLGRVSNLVAVRVVSDGQTDRDERRCGRGWGGCTVGGAISACMRCTGAGLGVLVGVVRASGASVGALPA